MEKKFLELQRARIVSRINKYNDPKRIQDELLGGSVSPYTHYKQKVIIPILENILLKMNRGEYGLCEKCEGEIETKRLELVPAARECIKCSRQSQHF